LKLTPTPLLPVPLLPGTPHTVEKINILILIKTMQLMKMTVVGIASFESNGAILSSFNEPKLSKIIGSMNSSNSACADLIVR
jgi:hypothetical protein